MRAGTYVQQIGALTLAAAAVAALVALPAGLAAQPVDDGGAGVATGEAPSPHGYLGVSVRNLTPELRRHFGAAGSGGVLVASVSPGSPAEAAGIAVGDVVVAVAGGEVASSSELRRAMRGRGGETVTLELIRDGAPRRLEATLGERRPEAFAVSAGAWQRDPAEWQQWAEEWQRWGEEMGEKWGSRWGEEMGEKWGRFGEEMAEKWGRRGEQMGEEWGRRGVEMGEMGAEIGLEVARAMAGMDWDEMDAAIEESMKALDAIDWEAISRQVERSLEGAEEQIERSLEGMERDLERAEPPDEPQ